MVAPARPPPAGNPSDEALEILRRLEFALARIEAEQKEQRADIISLKGDATELKGRVAGIEGQLRQIPTLWQLAGLIFAIFGASFVLIRFACGH
jgi:hypothetical protein